MKLSLKHIRSVELANIATKCPHCGHYGSFEQVFVPDVNSLNDKSHIEYFLGIRRCPNAKCYGYLFFILDNDNKQLITYPSISLPFDKENIPEKIIQTMEEVIICHSNSCFVSSAIMIRKTLEEICSDRGAKGNNLKEKIKDLDQDPYS